MRPQPRKTEITTRPPLQNTGRNHSIYASKESQILKAELERFKAFPSRISLYNYEPLLKANCLELITLPSDITPTENREWIITGLSFNFYPESFDCELNLNKPSTLKPVESPETPITPKNDTTLPDTTKERWGDPLRGYKLISAYGYRPSTRSWHCGLDFAAPKGVAIAATMSGVVSFAGSYGGYGNCVDVIHSLNGLSLLSRYGHMSVVSVSKGQTVRQGQKLGEVGSTGKSYGNHLHFEIRTAEHLFRQTGTLNPYLLVKGLTGVPGTVGSFTNQHSANSEVVKIAEKYR